MLLVISGATLAQTPTASGSRSTADPALERLHREITRLAQGAGGVVGVAALHLETGRRVAVNGSEAFPMASSYKLPIAVRLLHQIDHGEMSLDRMVQIQQNRLSPGSGTLSDLFTQPGVVLSVRNLLELMLLISDNTATDLLLGLAGGGGAVTARMRELGIDGIRVDRPTKQLIADWLGVAGSTDSQWTLEEFREQTRAVKPEERQTAAKRFDGDPRDTATPDATVTLLERLYRQQALNRESTDLLLDIMRRCRTGDARLKGLLPTGTEVAHKTGTIGGTTNDVGIITLPDGAGHVAIAVFVKSSDKEVAARERAIAEIARAVHDFFLFNPQTQ
jgi:beta-lactamase class A